MRTRLLTIGGILLVIGRLIPAAIAAGPATSLTVNPATRTITADETVTFTAIAKDKDGVETDVTAASIWSMNDPLGSLSGTTYHAGKVGTWNVQANFESLTDTAEITVTPGALKSLVINPNSDPEFVNRGAKIKFAVAGFDQNNNPVGGFNAVWSVVGTMGTIATNGEFSAIEIGNGKVQVSVGQITAQISVVVKEPDPEPTNANSNANVNTGMNSSANTNTAANSNANVNNNTNTNANENTNTTGNSNQNTNTGGSTNTTDECKTLTNWIWVLILIAFLLGVAILYALVPVTKIWPAVIGLGGAIALVVVQRTYGCNLMQWWGWVLSLAALGLTVLALRQLPTPKQNV